MGGDWSKSMNTTEGSLLRRAHREGTAVEKSSELQLEPDTANPETATASKTPMSHATKVTTGGGADSKRTCGSSTRTHDASMEVTVNSNSISRGSASKSSSPPTPSTLPPNSQAVEEPSERVTQARLPLAQTPDATRLAAGETVFQRKQPQQEKQRASLELRMENPIEGRQRGVGRNSLVSQVSPAEVSISDTPGRTQSLPGETGHNCTESRQKSNTSSSKSGEAVHPLEVPCHQADKRVQTSANQPRDAGAVSNGRDVTTASTRLKSHPEHCTTRPKEGAQQSATRAPQSQVKSNHAAPSHPGVLVEDLVRRHQAPASSVQNVHAKRAHHLPPESGSVFARTHHPGGHVIITDTANGGVRAGSGGAWNTASAQQTMGFPPQQRPEQRSENQRMGTQQLSQYNSQNITEHHRLQPQTAATTHPGAKTQRVTTSTSQHANQWHTRGIQQRPLDYAQLQGSQIPMHQPYQQPFHIQQQYPPHTFPFRRQGAHLPPWPLNGNGIQQARPMATTAATTGTATTAGMAIGTTSPSLTGQRPYLSAQLPFGHSQRMNQPTSGVTNEGSFPAIPAPPAAIVAATTAAEAALQKSMFLERSKPEVPRDLGPARSNKRPVPSRYAADSNVSTTQEPSEAHKVSAVERMTQAASPKHPDRVPAGPRTSRSTNSAAAAAPLNVQLACPKPNGDNSSQLSQSSKPPPMLEPLDSSQLSPQDIACIPVCFSYDLVEPTHHPNPDSFAEAMRKQDEWNREISLALQSSNGNKNKRKRPLKNEGRTKIQPASRSPPHVVESGPAGKNFPPGWTYKIVERMSGATKGSTDTYWFEPQTGKRFRSMAEIRRFLDALKAAGDGDEEKAWKTAKTQTRKES